MLANTESIVLCFEFSSGLISYRKASLVKFECFGETKFDMAAEEEPVFLV